MNHTSHSPLVPPRLIMTGVLIAGICNCLAGDFGAADAGTRGRTLLDAGWLFHRGEVADPHSVATNDVESGDWQTVHLPHDYQLDNPQFSQSNSRSQGYLAYTPAWYRKHVTIPEGDRGKVLRLDFDGVFRHCDVWLNGTRLGQHMSGYS